MVLILSINFDYSTKDVVDWLISLNQPFLIIQPNDKIDFRIENDKYFISFNNNSINLEEIESVWYRRGYINLSIYKNSEKLSQIIKNEFTFLRDLLYYLLKQKTHINKRSDNDINKLTTLLIAKEMGLSTPKSYYNSSKKNFTENLITKTISGSSSYIDDDKTYLALTKKVTFEDLKKIPKYTYLQEQIDKKYELRIFYLHRKFWSMAIFSQRDNQTEVDFRNYNYEKPNRNVPFKLPSEIESKLIKMMDKLDINSGSIDMIVSKNDHYVFLEVNPIGQFGMTSFPCNYNLEYEIANFLRYEERKER